MVGQNMVNVNLEFVSTVVARFRSRDEQKSKFSHQFEKAAIAVGLIDKKNERKFGRQNKLIFLDFVSYISPNCNK